MSLRAYTARCRLNRLRRAACRLFTSEQMVRAIRKLEVEIEARRLAVRRDRHLWRDVGEETARAGAVSLQTQRFRVLELKALPRTMPHT